MTCMIIMTAYTCLTKTEMENTDQIVVFDKPQCRKVIQKSAQVLVNCSGKEIKNADHLMGLEMKDSVCDVLDLSHNLISRISNGSFSSFTSIQVLNLSHNYIKEIHEGAFDHSNSLQKLDLSYNSLITLASNVFVKLSNLRTLVLSSNRLNTLPNALPMLEMFDVTNNSIEVLKESIYSSVLYPQYLFLIGQNPFACDCRTVWLKELLDTRKYILKFAKYIKHEQFFPKCKSPENLKSRVWDSISDTEFCDESKTGGIYRPESDSSERAKNDKSARSVSVETEEVGSTFVHLKWTIPSGTEGFSIEIMYHRFGQKEGGQTVILPLEAGRYRLKKLKPNTPYIICFNVLSGSVVQSNECLEVSTKKVEMNKTVSYFSWTYVMSYFQRYGTVIFISLVVVLLSFYATKDRSSENKGN